MFWLARYALLAVVFGGASWWLHNAVDAYNDSQANEAALVAEKEAHAKAVEAALIEEARLKGEALKREQILSDALEKREAELVWARDQKANDESIKAELRANDTKLDECLGLIVDPRLLP